MVYLVLGALLHYGVSIGGPPNNYFFIFYFFFIFEKSLNMYNPLESLPVYFKKTLKNPVHPSLDITI